MTKILRLSILFGLTVGILQLSPAGKTQNPTVAQHLNQIEQQLAKAVVERDLQTYSSLLAPDWTTIDLTGRVLTKSQVMEELASKERQIEAATIDDIRVRDLGEVAVVTGRTTATGSYQGKRSTVVLRFTDVFARRDGKWQVVASQGTQVMK
jgi:ketosteroid isomerase-like protein